MTTDAAEELKKNYFMYQLTYVYNVINKYLSLQKKSLPSI